MVGLLGDQEVSLHLAINHYVDSCLGALIDRLETSGLPERSIVVITGDHSGITLNRLEGRKMEPADRFVPLIVLGAGEG